MLTDINLNLYKTFINIYESKSISKAAKKMFISQPAVSLNLKSLESQLGIKLFTKEHQNYIPTNNGTELYNALKISLNSLEIADNIIFNKEVFKGKIKIGVQSHIFTALISKLLKSFKSRYPEIEFEVNSRSTNEMIGGLDINYLDIVFDTYPISRPSENIVIEPITKMDNIFYCKSDMDFPDKIKVEDLNNFPLILPLDSSKHIDELKKAIGNVEMLPIITCGTSESIRDLVKEGLGIGYSIRDFLSQDLANGVIREIQTDKELPLSEIYCCYNKATINRISKCFLDYLIDYRHKQNL